MDLQTKLSKDILEKIKILVVDDEPRIISALKRILKNEPHEIRYFTDPEEALSDLKKEEFSLVISDNMMPKISGLELLGEVKKTSPFCGRILLTGATPSDEVIEAFNEGRIDRYIGKPWENEKLLEYIHQALEKHRKEKLEYLYDLLKDQTIKGQARRYENTLLALKQAETQLELRKDRESPKRIWLPDAIRNLSFMVVEEHKELRDALVNTLREANIRYVASFENGVNGLAYLSHVSSVDVILSDWDMKSIDGLRFFRSVKAKKDLTPQPFFILMTTKEKKKEVKFALKAGVDGYIIKPFKLNTIADQLLRLLENRIRE